MNLKYIPTARKNIRIFEGWKKDHEKTKPSVLFLSLLY